MMSMNGIFKIDVLFAYILFNVWVGELLAISVLHLMFFRSERKMLLKHGEETEL